MSLRSFSKDTLQDNWYEERSGPLRGVLPHDCNTNYTTTNVSEFVNPDVLKAQNQVHKHADVRPRLIRRDNFEQAIKSRPLRDRPDHGFGAVLPTPDVNAENRYLETSNQAAFGSVVKASALSVPNEQLGSAGGAGGLRVERGKAASGASGEVIKHNADPQKDTHAQRSWMYTKDPIFSVTRAQVTPDNQAALVKPAHYRRQATSITTVDQKKPGTFIDD
ncbi:Aste57867_22860 [Aphanomyces stellatus]|uniref:Aste57867_22860 protein n=1 Tax=Aphanomyces stellatus TaxID=120398 RepID=A0A485LM97_9STRA|nr:hypothetical protein As57867_022789 [Aphanomyces stellatus]VFT99510.1 Aste57867_22860 [Aphanomyces stellatus]